MIAAFTICSNNYLAQALTLQASLRKHAPGWKFIIGLVDEPTSIDGVVLPSDCLVLPVDAIGIASFESMAETYNIIELCTATKPYYFKYLFDNFPEFEQIHYLDPDTFLYADPTPIAHELASASILLTPHHYTPIPLDGLFPAENLALNHGIYNLGYLGLRRSEQAANLLGWWGELMAQHCRIDLKEGWFVDQLPFNFVPIYFDGVKVTDNAGINGAYWNFHERCFPKIGVVEFRGQQSNLILYHFSGFSPHAPDRPTKIDARLDWTKNPALPQMLADYADALLTNGYDAARTVESPYQRKYLAAKRRQYLKENGPLKRTFRKLRSLVQ